jgi:hypothetical protein
MASAQEPNREGGSLEEPPGVVDALTPWLLVVLATLASAGAIIRAVGDSTVPWRDRLNETTLLYLAVGGALLLLRRIKALSFGGYKLEMLKQIRERQLRTEDLLKNVTSRLLPLLLPKPEQNHLLNLDAGRTDPYEGGTPLQAELRRLVAAQLLQKKDAHISSLKQGVHFDLADYVELTPLGRQWVKSIRENEAAGSPAVGRPAQQKAPEPRPTS